MRFSWQKSGEGGIRGVSVIPGKRGGYPSKRTELFQVLECREYVAERAERKFSELLRGDSGLSVHEVAEEFYPIILGILTTHFPEYRGTAEEEDFICAALSGLYSILQGENLQIARGRVKRFREGQLAALIRHLLLKFVKKELHLIQPQVFDFGDACMYPPQARLLDQRTVEDIEFIREYPRILFMRFEDRLRFYGSTGDACRYIAQRLIHDQCEMLQTLRGDYRLTQDEIKFFIPYTRSVIRICHRELRGVYRGSLRPEVDYSHLRQIDPYRENSHAGDEG